jgi:hypothetical protein
VRRAAQGFAVTFDSSADSGAYAEPSRAYAQEISIAFPGQLLGGGMRRVIVAVAIMAGLVAAPSTQASTGTFTRAFTNATWTQGSLAGSVTWTDCQPSFSCRWLAVITAQPSLPSYSCWGDELFDSDPNTRQVWAGSGTSNGTIAFDVPNADILQGVQGQRVCLSAVYDYWRQNPVCVVQAPILGMDPADCPFEAFLATKVLSSTLLTVPPPPAATPAPTESGPTSTSTQAKKRRCPKGKRRVIRSGKVRCVKRRPGKRGSSA